MDVVVCVKRVPLTQEVDLEIDPGKRDIKKESLAYVINEWDNYAIEEAVRLKEDLGGTVTAVTIGTEDDEEVLTRCLAMGADRALRVDPGDLEMDSFVLSRILGQAIKGMEYDLILTGVQSDDANNGAAGVMLAEQLGLAHAAVVNGVEAEAEAVRIRVELEGGLEEGSRIRLPVLLTIQTGINDPRYVSIMGIRKAAKKELKVVTIEDLGLSREELSPMIFVEEVFLPPEAEGAEFLEGDAPAVAEAILRIMKEKGVNV